MATEPRSPRGRSTKRGGKSGTKQGLNKLPHNPISLRQVETVVSRSVAFFGLVFAAQATPVLLGQLNQLLPRWALVLAGVVLGGIIASVIASMARRFVRIVNAALSFAFLAALVAWPFVQNDPLAVAKDRPWLWLVVTIATGAAAQAFSVWAATTYLFVASFIYGVVRITPSGGGKDLGSCMLDVVYVIILGGCLLILITILRQAAASVDNAQATALDRYSHAVRQHATEVERVRVDAIVHDSVLTTFISASRATTPEAMELAATMAISAVGHLTDAAQGPTENDTTVDFAELSQRIIDATTHLAAPFEVRLAQVSAVAIPAQSAEAVYSAAVQAMVNSLQHAGDSAQLKRWVAIMPWLEGGISVDVGDTGVGFVVKNVPAERLGVRVSMIERVANAGGFVDITSSVGSGTLVRILWPSPARAHGMQRAENRERVSW